MAAGAVGEARGAQLPLSGGPLASQDGGGFLHVEVVPRHRHLHCNTHPCGVFEQEQEQEQRQRQWGRLCGPCGHWQPYLSWCFWRLKGEEVAGFLGSGMGSSGQGWSPQLQCPRSHSTQTGRWWTPPSRSTRPKHCRRRRRRPPRPRRHPACSRLSPRRDPEVLRSHWS